MPVSLDKQGRENVPFKTVCDAIGLNWRSQKRKIINSDYYRALFCVSLSPAKGHQIEPSREQKRQYLIRLDRVSTFFDALNPVTICAQGNKSTAGWLFNNRYEWDGALEEYENSIRAIAPVEKHHSQAFLDLDIAAT